MARILNDTKLRDAVQLYQSGLTTYQVAKQFSCDRSTICNWLRTAGVKCRDYRTPVPNKETLILAYQGGESTKAIARRLGIHARIVIQCLTNANIPIRGLSEAGELHWNTLSPVQRNNQIHAAHLALRGHYEEDVARMIIDHGFPVGRQVAVGPYTIDITLKEMPIAVEVTSFCPSRFRTTNSRQRTEYLLNAGWLLIYLRRSTAAIQPNGRPVPGYFSMAHVTKEILPLFERARRDHSVFGKYRMVLCHPKYHPRLRYDLDGLPNIE